MDRTQTNASTSSWRSKHIGCSLNYFSLCTFLLLFRYADTIFAITWNSFESINHDWSISILTIAWQCLLFATLWYGFPISLRLLCSKRNTRKPSDDQLFSRFVGFLQPFIAMGNYAQTITTINRMLVRVRKRCRNIWCTFSCLWPMI